MKAIPAFRLEGDRLRQFGRELRPVFASAEPFPHAVVPDFLPLPIAKQLAAEFPGLRDIEWQFAGPGDTRHSGDVEIEKVQCPREDQFPPLIRHVMHELNSAAFLDFLTELTGYEGLQPDPWFDGCGLHSTGRGGRLMVHADQDRHSNPKMHQILNAIYYVTPDWDEGWGGQLELWDRDAKTCIKKVSPTFNSLVVFYTGAKAFHGHPHPLQTPPGVRRNSMAAYYYIVDRPLDEDYDGRIPHVIWKQTNEHDVKDWRVQVRDAAFRISPFLARKAEGVWEGLKR